MVYEKKIAKEVDAYQVSQALSSFYVVEATAAPGHDVAELYTELMRALTRALATPPSEAELGRAISAYKKSFFGRIEGVQSRASTLASYYHLAGRGDYLSEDLQRYVGATAAAVQAAGQRYLDLTKFVRVDIVPGKKEVDAASAGPSPAQGQARGEVSAEEVH